MSLKQALDKCATLVAARIPEPPRIGVVLGSGFNAFADAVEGVRIPYSVLPGFPKPSVPGHEGALLIGRVRGQTVAVLSGRAHYYEGFAMDQVTFPIRLLARIGVAKLVLTNAAGGIARELAPGRLMIISDHINLMGANPLRGSEFVQPEDRFVDLSRLYDPELRKLMRRAARRAGLRATEGVYLAVQGPSYETPAEIAAFARLGADAVGMSTVPEAIVGAHCGMRVAAVSCITNRAAGLARGRLSHTEVLELAARMAPRLRAFLEWFVVLAAEA